MVYAFAKLGRSKVEEGCHHILYKDRLLNLTTQTMVGGIVYQRNAMYIKYHFSNSLNNSKMF